MVKKRRHSLYCKSSIRKSRALKPTKAPLEGTLLPAAIVGDRAAEIFLRVAIVILFCLSGFCQSPPPSADIENRVDSILGQMTLEEKIDLLGGVDDFYVRGVPRLNVPRLKMADGPLGVRNYGPATTMAGGIALAASWNPDLAERVGTEIGRDARAKGVHFL